MNDLRKLLQQLNSFDLLLVLAYVTARWLRHKLSQLHPANLVLPIATIQILFFVVAVGTATNVIQTLAVGNLLIVAFALLPITVPHSPKVKAHWIRPHE